MLVGDTWYLALLLVTTETSYYEISVGRYDTGNEVANPNLELELCELLDPGPDSTSGTALAR